MKRVHGNKNAYTSLFRLDINIYFLSTILRSHKALRQEKIFKNLNRLKSSKKILLRELSSHNTFILLLILFISGTVFRANGLRFGLPLRLHTDEVAVVEKAVVVAASGDLNPGIYNRPNHVSIYLSAIFYKAFSAVRCFFLHDCEGIQAHFSKHPAPYVFLSRIITACLGSLMILSMFFLAKEVGGKKVGLLASALTAFFPSFIRHSHYATPDIPLTFFISMVALWISKYMKTRKLKFLILGCLFSGIATAEKYPGILSMTMIFFGVVFSHRRKRRNILKLLPLSILIFLSSFFIAAPFVFLNYKEVLKALAEEKASYHLGASGLGWGGNLLYYIGTWLDNTGILLSLFFLLGLVLFILEFRAYMRVKHYFTVSLFGLIYWALISTLAIHWERWAVPIYIIPIIIASVGIDWLAAFLNKKKIGWRFFFTVILAVILSSLFFRGIMQSLSFSWKDTRVVSKDWIGLNLPTHAKIVADAYTPLKPGCCGSVAVKSLEQFKKEGIEYVIVSSLIYQRILAEKDRYSNEVKFYTELFEREYLVKEFWPANMEFGKNDITAVYRTIKELIHYLQHREMYLRGPVIKIYRISERKT